MDDKQIVALYWERSENAIAETQKKYGKYCRAIAASILSSELDAEECVNDTYLRAWQSMPPHKPSRLSTFLGKITRNLALNRYAHDRAQKRKGEVELALEELAEVLPDPSSQGSPAEELVLRDAINRFVGSLSRQSRVIFVRRYFYLCPIKEIAKGMGLSENAVKVTLSRTRNKFRIYLEKEGISI